MHCNPHESSFITFVGRFSLNSVYVEVEVIPRLIGAGSYTW